MVSASATISISLCPTPTVSISTTSQPAASSTRRACGVAHASPPRWPRVAIERMNTPSSVACSPIRTRSPSSAPPENGDDGSTASTPTRRPVARTTRTSSDVVVDLPTPGGPVRPTTCARPVCGASAAATAGRSGPPSSTSEISRATASCSPRRARSTRSGTSSRRTDTAGGQLAAGTRMIRPSPCPPPPQRPAAPDAAAAPPELQRQVQRDPSPGHADRVAERDRPAVDVDLLRVDAELAGRDDADRGERLVDLHEVEVARARCPPWRTPRRSRWPAARAGWRRARPPRRARRSRPASSGPAPRPWPCSSPPRPRHRRRSARRSRP